MQKKVSSSKGSKKNYRNKAISLAKLIAKRRDRYTCQRCGKVRGDGQIHASHIIPVAKGSLLSADPDNIIALCAGCHKTRVDSWHQSPLHQDWFNEKFPGKKEDLMKRFEQRNIAPYEWEELYRKLQDIWKSM